jgi:valyl-tRNA synthetase
MWAPPISGYRPRISTTALVGQMKLLFPMAELKRLQKERDKKLQDKDRPQGKLSNANFVDKAPADVVAVEHNKLAAMETAL